MQQYKIDLHTHTIHSDGALTPTELVQKAHELDLKIISITDHDSINGLDEAIACGNDLGIEVIPGVEISTDIDNKEMHILGYFFDPGNEELHKYLKFFREERIHRAKRMVSKLKSFGLNISMDDVFDVAQNSAIGRPHVAATLVQLGLVGNYYEAFEKYLKDNGPAYERKIHVSPQSALKLINDAGGLSFIAHPGNVDETILMHFIKAGIVNQYCLLESGGSDYHGGVKGDDGNLGKFCVSPATVDAMRQMLTKNDYN